MKCKITIISDSDSWINKFIPELKIALEELNCTVSWQHDVNIIQFGDLVFFLGCGQMVSSEILRRNKHNLVVHESSLPEGRGWSPLSWQILEGKNEITISLFEAEEKVDSGQIYLQDIISFEGHELVDEFRKVQAETSITMCINFVLQYPNIIQKGIEQSGVASYYPKRTPENSQLDPDKTISDQFNLLRIVDNEKYPAFFTLSGRTYLLKIEKMKKEDV